MRGGGRRSRGREVTRDGRRRHILRLHIPELFTRGSAMVSKVEYELHGSGTQLLKQSNIIIANININRSFMFSTWRQF